MSRLIEGRRERNRHEVLYQSQGESGRVLILFVLRIGWRRQEGGRDILIPVPRGDCCLGRLAGSVSRPCGSGSQGTQFKPHVGCKAWLKNKYKLKKKSTKGVTTV